MVDSHDRRIRIVKNGRTESGAIALVGEEPLSIRVQGSPYAVVMRTPGAEKPHVAGFCLGEGIVDAPGDLANIAFCDGEDTNVVTVTVTDARRRRIADHLDRRTYISQTSCGICGKTIVADLVQALSPVADLDPLDGTGTLGCLLRLGDHQPLRDKTRAAHGAAIYDHALNPLSVAEDVGRHNALDKAIGSLFLDGNLDQARLLTLSSRISYELVQKAARARIPVILAISRPTALAVRLAEALNMTLASLGKDDSLMVYCHPHRLAWPQ
ncbi:sulfurtransferase FdhD [Desulfosarcina alkanivorans]|uniref:Sulfur carrier protein FdhD n=1 Tax=Desulfosarcina alkanivorans TaxID=571177 RepID=A0A5K7Z1T1_9BACT|nr:formate dehydrogenase accessory sulfurtransferase FdhD [Desulfosarcina alkanivorans]BBO70727.1 sulfurtransferase FdhD [Desulfosarcina alkanivorans]